MKERAWDIRLVHRSIRQTLNKMPIMSQELARTMAIAYAKQTPIPGVIELWVLEPDGAEVLVRAWPGQK